MREIPLRKLFAILVVVGVAAINGACQQKSPSSAKPFNVREIPARTFNISPSNLPKPFATESVARPSKIIRRTDDAILFLPKGFSINIFAEGDFSRPRMMTVAPNGDVFVSDAGTGKIIMLRDADKDGSAEQRFTFAENLNLPFGMAFLENYLYVANTDSVVRFAYKTGQTKAEGAPEKIIDLPGKGYNQHWTRNITFSPDKKKLYVTVGSESNVEVEADPRRAAISVYDVDGKNQRVFASGLRNPVGLAINPVNGDLWTAVNERDGLGDDLVPDYVTSVRDGAFYGWPFSYLGQNEDPRRKGENPEAVKRAIVPDVLVQSHSAALGMIFYNGKMFPEEYRNDAYVAFHGSWNRAKLTGYKIARIRFKDGKPIGGYEDFLTGWLPDENGNEVWGRPVGLAVAEDGALLVCDDGADMIWRVTFSASQLKVQNPNSGKKPKRRI